MPSGYSAMEGSERYNRHLAGWQSGYAADCKSAYAGSIPTSASKLKAPLRRGFFFVALLLCYRSSAHPLIRSSAHPHDASN